MYGLIIRQHTDLEVRVCQTKVHKIKTKVDQQKGNFHHVARGQNRQWELPLAARQYFASLKQCPLGVCKLRLLLSGNILQEWKQRTDRNCWNEWECWTQSLTKQTNLHPDIRSVPVCRGVELEGTGDSGCNLSTLFDIHPLYRASKSLPFTQFFWHEEETSVKFSKATTLTRYAPVPVCLIVASLKLTIAPKNVRARDKDRQIDVYLPRDYGEQRRGN